MINKSTISFLKDLKTNNSREWFLSKESAYNQSKQEYILLIQDVIKLLSKKSKAYADIEASKCLFRINRDVRFSQNKAPYKTNFGASINLYGKKSPKAGFYIHIEPGASFVGGGIYMPPSDLLFKVRQEIDYNFQEFNKILKNKDFISSYGKLDMDDALKNPPRGFDKENIALEYLKLKSFVAFAYFTDKEIQQTNFAELVANKLIALLPMISFINKALDE
jgi:uncharacterized protein (TIGR02453 family)